MALLKSFIEIDDELLKESSEMECDTEQFYRSNLSELNKIPLSELDPDTVRKIAVICKSSEIFPSDWELIVYPLIQNSSKKYMTMAAIKASAEVYKELPLSQALKTELIVENQNIGKLVDVLLGYKHFHALKEIQPQIIALLETFRRLQRQNHLLNEEIEELPVTVCCTSKNEQCCDKTVSEKEGVFSNTYKDHHGMNVLPPKSLCMPKESLDHWHMVPKDYHITVFIPHTNEISQIVKEFSSRLRNQYNVDARAMCEIEHLLPINNRIWDSVLPNMDFILPIISPEYLDNLTTYSLNQAYSHPSDNFVKNIYIYQYMLNEFVINRCYNFRCRAIITCDTDAKKVMSFPLFYACYELTQIEELVKELYLIKGKRNRPHVKY